ncbi:MAG: C69 family dipeptidase [Anaerolineales bacterium]|nr:C69 family dipeptidase [Anaerolineales bacterium]MCB9143922.1 C69 family dipeptidase [Anaerolineales bacterium]
MCDTLIATKFSTADGVAVFGKNSDRLPNEGQHLASFPASDHAPNSKVKCTYIEIPQSKHTHAIFLSKPYWMWGAEMGVNEHGLVIGNEAIYSKIPANKKPALLGMDLLRLALERAVTPREAMQVIIDLLEEFGQGGNCVHEGELYYHNSFIIANANDAWVLETIDKQWAAKQVKDVYSISNCLTIGNQYDLSSSNLVDFAIQKGIAKSKNEFHLDKFHDFLYTNFGKGQTRRATTLNALASQKRHVGIESMAATLRHHKDENFDPSANLAEQDVCMHAGFGPFRITQSTASLVVYLDGTSPIIFATGTSAPCTSLFKPFWVDTASFLTDEPVPTHLADSNTLFWQHERLHRAVLMDYAPRLQAYAPERDEMEKRFINGALKLKSASVKERTEFSKACYAESRAAEAKWLKQVESIPARNPLFHSMAWGSFNKKARF